MPGAGFKKKAAYWKDAKCKTIEMPWRFVESQHSQGIARDSVATALLDSLPPIGDGRQVEEDYARSTAAGAFVGGADTSLSSLQAFFMAMALYPDAQQKAQAELDSLWDLPPLCERCHLELSRWHSVLPLGAAHTSITDDEYDGYFIPKGSIILGNTWFIMHDPETYDQPLEFRPERFLKDGEIDPSVQSAEVAAFGFGRRICPGRHFADNALFSLVSSVLSVFTVSHAKDEHGNIIPIHPR
ncbi:cytochrome P450 [Infundibulicybe gibba]|nr:cytochrome P450 [Infundibulicybe gibba]